MKNLLLLLGLFVCLFSQAQVINSNAPIILTGSGTVWDDVVVTATQTRVTPATSLPAFEQDSIALKFVRDADSSEVCFFNLQIPHRVAYGATVTCNPHFHWQQYAAADTTYEIILKYRIIKIGQPPTAWTRLTPTARAYILPYTGAGHHQITEFPDILLNNVSESSLIDFRLYRRDSAGNPATLYFKSFDVHFEMNKLGTVDEYPSH